MAYFLPFETMLNSWLSAVPTYEWEQAPPADDGGTPSPGVDPTVDTPADDESVASRLRLVFKGLQLVATPQWTLRENPMYEVLRRAQSGDEHDEAREIARKPALPRPAAANASAAPAGDAAPPAGGDSGPATDI